MIESVNKSLNQSINQSINLPNHNVRQTFIWHRGQPVSHHRQQIGLNYVVYLEVKKFQKCF